MSDAGCWCYFGFPHSSQVFGEMACRLPIPSGHGLTLGDTFPSVSESDYLLPLWAKSPAGGWVQDCP